MVLYEVYTTVYVTPREGAGEGTENKMIQGGAPPGGCCIRADAAASFFASGAAPAGVGGGLLYFVAHCRKIDYFK